jgi:hypothetical protein
MSRNLVPFVFGREAVWDPLDLNSHLFDTHFGSNLINDPMALYPTNRYFRRHPLRLILIKHFIFYKSI